MNGEHYKFFAEKRIAELEAELAIYKRRWEIVERLATSDFRGGELEWSVSDIWGDTFSQAVDEAGKGGE